MIVTRRIIMTAFAVVTLSSCGTKELPPLVDVDQPVEVSVIQQLSVAVLHKADYNIDDSQTVKGFKVLATDTDYRTELARYSVEVPKPIDFSQNRVLVSTMGTQGRGGFIISAVRAEEYAEKVVVTVELTVPGASCITTQAVSNPYEFAIIPTLKPIEFVESVVISQCA